MAMVKEKIDFRTRAEIDREKQWDEVCARYKDLHAQNPEVKPTRLFSFIAGETLYTSQQVRNIIINRGMYVPKTMKG